MVLKITKSKFKAASESREYNAIMNLFFLIAIQSSLDLILKYYLSTVLVLMGDFADHTTPKTLVMVVIDKSCLVFLTTMFNIEISK